MSKIQAFFWDYDNTILETAEAHWKKHLTVLARHGIELEEKHRQRVYENNGAQNWEWMRRELHLKIPQDQYLHEIDAEFQRYMGMLEMRPGVAELFDNLEQLNIPQAIITNARRASAEPVLAAHGILKRMQFVLYKEDYVAKKPDPAPYFAGFEKMLKFFRNGLDPKKCVAVEDDPKGVEAAYKAGFIVIHRRFRESDQASPYANFSCFQKNEFISIVKKLLSN